MLRNLNSRKAPQWKLQEVNKNTLEVIQNHIAAAVENVLSGVRYERVQNNGPRYPKVNEDTPLTHR